MQTDDMQANDIERLDIAAADSLKPLAEREPVKAVAKTAKLADEPPLLAASAAVTAVGLFTGNRRLAEAGIRMLAAHGLATGIKNAVKDRVDRTRPKLLDEGEYRMEPGKSKDKKLRSFPSGHAAGIAAVARAATRVYPVGPAALLVATVFSGLQVLRRAHYPGDVLAGVGAGLVAEAISGRALRPLLRARAFRTGMTRSG